MLPTLRLSDSGLEVLLASHLLALDPPTDTFTEALKQSVTAFQQSHCLNPDGVIGPKTWPALIYAAANLPLPAADSPRPPDFKQYDSRWAAKMYSSHNDKSQTMRSSGCGPTAMADIAAHWWDPAVTPYDLALKALAWGCRTYDSGTAASFFGKCAAHYGASDYHSTASVDEAISCLRSGGLVIANFGPGTKGKSSWQKWTKGGHYCLLWAYENGVFLIHDPASSSDKRARGTRAEVQDARKRFHCFKR